MDYVVLYFGLWILSKPDHPKTRNLSAEIISQFRIYFDMIFFFKNGNMIFLW